MDDNILHTTRYCFTKVVVEKTWYCFEMWKHIFFNGTEGISRRAFQG